MSWYSKEIKRDIDHEPIEGLFFLHGAIVAKLRNWSWAENMKSPRILFPSGLERGICAFDCPLVQLFNALDLPLFETRDEAYITAMEWNEDGCFSVFKVGNNQLELWDHETETVYRVTYDNTIGE